MRFWITKNPKVALILIPWFVPVNQTREEMYLELRHRLAYNPDETLVCLIIDNDLIKGMGIAYCRYNDVFIWQASTSKDIPRSIVDSAFRGILHWSKSKGFGCVSGMPNRAKKIWLRRWGFMESKKDKDEVYLEI